MKKIPVYVNPYDKVHFGPSTVMTLHRFGIFDPDVARRVPTLSPFSAKLTAHLRFQVAQRPAWPHHNDSKCSGGLVACGDGPDRSTFRL
jgi:hypothetical protein